MAEEVAIRKCVKIKRLTRLAQAIADDAGEILIAAKLEDAVEAIDRRIAACEAATR